MFCFLKFICMDSAYLRKPRAITRFFSAWDSEGRNPLLWYVRGNVDKHTNVPIIQFNELCTAGTLLTQPPTATIKRCHQSCHLLFPFPSQAQTHHTLSSCGFQSENSFSHFSLWKSSLASHWTSLPAGHHKPCNSLSWQLHAAVTTERNPGIYIGNKRLSRKLTSVPPGSLAIYVHQW